MRPRSNFIGKDAAVGENEKLYAENADIVESVSNAASISLGAFSRFLVDSSRHDRIRQDAVLMMVLCDGENSAGAVGAARDDDGDFKLKAEHAFKNAVDAAKRLECAECFCARVDASLSLAVVAEACGFEDAREKRIVQLSNVGL